MRTTEPGMVCLREGLSYDPQTDTLRIGNTGFAIGLLEGFIQAIRDGEALSPVTLKLSEDERQIILTRVHIPSPPPTS